MALQAAVAIDDIHLVRILLSAQETSTDHEETYHKYPALYQAVRDQRHELVEILLASNIDLSIPMSEATGFMCYVPKVHKWVYDIRYFKISPWLVALESKNLRLVRIFLGAGADPNQSFWSEISPQNCLSVAIKGRDLPLMQTLLEADADVNVDMGPDIYGFNTSLGCAARYGETDIVRLLLKAGANPNVPANGCSQRTALQAATEYGHEDVFDILLQADADVNVPPSPDRGVTALQAAAIKGFLRLARVLIDAGADVNAAAAEYQGRTALAGAAEHGRIDMLQYLLDNGASIDGAGRAQYESAIELAALNGHQSACNLLKSHQRSLCGSS